MDNPRYEMDPDSEPEFITVNTETAEEFTFATYYLVVSILCLSQEDTIGCHKTRSAERI